MLQIIFLHPFILPCKTFICKLRKLKNCLKSAESVPLPDNKKEAYRLLSVIHIILWLYIS